MASAAKLLEPRHAAPEAATGPARITPARRAEGEASGDWRRDAEAKRILSAFVADFPESFPGWSMARRDYGLTSDEWKVYRGPEVDRLRRIYERVSDMAEALHAQGFSRPLDNFVRTPAVDVYLDALWLGLTYGEARP